MKVTLMFLVCSFCVLVSIYLFNNISCTFLNLYDTIKNGFNGVSDEVSELSSSVYKEINEFNVNISEFHDTVKNVASVVSDEVLKLPGNANNGFNVVEKQFSKLTKLGDNVVCNDILTGMLISVLIECNPHAFITDTLDVNDTKAMDICKLVEIVSFTLPMVADLATAPVQIVCSFWVEERLKLYSHLQGIEVNKFTPLGVVGKLVGSNMKYIDNDKLFYELAKMNDQYCNNDCIMDDYEFMEPLSNSENGRFKRGIVSQSIRELGKTISKKAIYATIPKIFIKNGVAKSMIFRGLMGRVSNKASTMLFGKLWEYVNKENVDQTSIWDLFKKYKFVPNTFTTKYYNHHTNLSNLTKIGLQNWYLDFQKFVRRN